MEERCFLLERFGGKMETIEQLIKTIKVNDEIGVETFYGKQIATVKEIYQDKIVCTYSIPSNYGNNNFNSFCKKEFDKTGKEIQIFPQGYNLYRSHTDQLTTDHIIVVKELLEYEKSCRETEEMFKEFIKNKPNIEQLNNLRKLINVN